MGIERIKINKKTITFVTFGLLVVALLWFSQKRPIPDVDTIVSPTKLLEQSVIDEDVPFSIYEDLKAGYKFAYPEVFQIKNMGTYVEVSSSGKGKIIIQIMDKSFKTEIIEDNLIPEESVMLQKADNIIKDTFEFVEQKYSEKELYKRFMISSPSGTPGN